MIILQFLIPSKTKIGTPVSLLSPENPIFNSAVSLRACEENRTRELKIKSFLQRISEPVEDG